MKPSETRAVFEDETDAHVDISDISGDTWTRFSDRIDNDFYFLARQRSPTLFRVNTPAITATAAGTAITTLGSIRARGCGVFHTNDSDEKTLAELPMSAEGDSSDGYFWDEKTTTIKFTGNIVDQSEKFIVSHIPKRTPITALSDEMITPFPEYPEYLIRVYERSVALWRKGQNLGLADVAYKNALEQLMSELDRMPQQGLDTNAGFF